MATAVASRFAVLKDDVDDDYTGRKRQPQPKKPEQPVISKTAAKKKKNKENAQPQTQAKTKPKTKIDNSTGSKKKNGEVPLKPEQWEEWKEKDEQYVAHNYKDDMSKAIALSKLDFEEKKEFYKEQAKTAEPPAPSQPPDAEKKGRKKNKTVKVLSVEEFHNLGKVISKDYSPPTSEPIKPDPEYFQRLDEEINREVAKKPTTKKTVNIRQPLDDEALSLAQMRDKLDKKVEEIGELRLENISLKEENNNLRDDLKAVKTRNKTLCHILANGEMKDKAEILMDVERLQTVRDELSEQVASLAGQLEQERSRVRALTNSNIKVKNKRTTSSGDN